MPDPILNGWLVSPYTAKTRAYFHYKGIAFEEKTPTFLRLMTRIKKAVGAAIMPTVELPDGRWLQDSSDIIDTFESSHPEPSITPPGATQRVASLLLELHGDEWLPMVALHYRWNVPENHRFAISEFARCGFPFLPGPIGRRAAKPVAGKMKQYLPMLGVNAATRPGLESFTETFIARLNAHLADHRFLLGDRACMGDFAVYGPLWAHLHRDPASRHLFDSAANVTAWFDRLSEPGDPSASFLADDEVPETLTPLFQTLFAEQFVYVRKLVAAVDRYCADNPDAPRVPRALGKESFVLGGCEGQRKLITFTQWMAQRPHGAYAETKGDDRARVDAWLDRVGGEGLREPIANPMARREFRMELARSQ